MEERVKYMAQGTVNGRKTRRVRHMEEVEAEKRYGRIMATLTLLGGILIGVFVTMIVQSGAAL